MSSDFFFLAQGEEVGGRETEHGMCWLLLAAFGKASQESRVPELVYKEGGKGVESPES